MKLGYSPEVVLAASASAAAVKAIDGGWRRIHHLITYNPNPNPSRNRTIL